MSSPLHTAIRAYNLQEALRLIDVHDANINDIDDHGESVLCCAIKHADSAFIQNLICQGVNVNSQDGQGRTAIYLG